MSYLSVKEKNGGVYWEGALIRIFGREQQDEEKVRSAFIKLNVGSIVGATGK